MSLTYLDDFWRYDKQAGVWRLGVKGMGHPQTHPNSFL